MGESRRNGGPGEGIDALSLFFGWNRELVPTQRIRKSGGEKGRARRAILAPAALSALRKPMAKRPQTGGLRGLVGSRTAESRLGGGVGSRALRQLSPMLPRFLLFRWRGQAVGGGPRARAPSWRSAPGCPRRRVGRGNRGRSRRRRPSAVWPEWPGRSGRRLRSGR